LHNIGIQDNTTKDCVSWVSLFIIPWGVTECYFYFPVRVRDPLEKLLTDSRSWCMEYLQAKWPSPHWHLLKQN